MNENDVNKDEAISAGFQIIQGSSAQMRYIKDAEIDLVVTSPPYFPDDVEELLIKPKAQQKEYEYVLERITEFALTLRPIFKEIKRVLRPGHAMIMQTKDLRYGSFLLPLSDLHQELAINCGLRLVSRIHWLSTPGSRSRLPKFTQTRRRRDYRALDTETFMIFAHPEGLLQGDVIQSLDKDTAFELIQPLWRLPPNGGKHSHRYGSPKKIVNQFIELFSDKGDLILDPFAGYGTTLIEAKRLGRRAIGYDIDAECVTMTEKNLDGLIMDDRK